MKYKYQSGVLGGTFDHLHLGHKDLLDTAFSQSEKVTIGLATKKIYQQKFLSHIIESYKIRELELKKYLKEKKYLLASPPGGSRVEIIPLNDIFGTTLEIKNFSAIFVTKTTLPNALIINDKRNIKGLTPLEIIKVPLRKDESGHAITSERIRLGEIDRAGHVYMNIFKGKTELKLPAHLRQAMRDPIGKTIKDVIKIKTSKPEKSLLITVGDIVTKSLKEIHVFPDIEFIDFKTRRLPMDIKSFEDYKLKKKKMYNNPAGSIQTEAVNIYSEAIAACISDQVKQRIVIDGEEDLLTLPAILLAPLGSYVCYGQFDLNAVILVEVTEENKKHIFDLLQQFE